MMRELLLEELVLSERIVYDGAQVVPRFRTLGPNAEFTIFMPLSDDSDTRMRGLGYIRQFMAWKGATGVIMSAETWLGQRNALQDSKVREGEAIVSTFVSKTDIGGVLRIINRRGGISFGAPMWFDRDSVDDALLQLLPGKEEEMSPEMLDSLRRQFGAGGEFPARRRLS
jgi:hypothetical protein